MSWIDDAGQAVLADTKAVRLDANVLGVTLHFADGHSLLISNTTCTNLSQLIHHAERQVLDEYRKQFHENKT
jgi:hypothetical protein